MTPSLTRPTGISLNPDNSRVIVRSFIPGDRTTILHIIERALALTEEEIEARLEDLQANFAERHLNIKLAWLRHYRHVQGHLRHEASLSDARRLYIGALFSGEYALESAALFNPSLVPHPDQTGLHANEMRFIMSLRATGEGHISSIAFRTGVIHADHSITLEQPSRFVTAPELNPNPSFRRNAFFRKLREIGFANQWSEVLMESLGDRFTRNELNAALSTASGATRRFPREAKRTIDCIRWMAEANYEVCFSPSAHLSERIIFPVSPNESNGMEDARFVRFAHDDGTIVYYATYTAYNGRTILPQFLETSDFLQFQTMTLNGAAARNKGMALFPRRIDGRFAMISRQDDENLYLMFSDELQVWEEARLLHRPGAAWESVKIGNCGSPIETEAGWLVLTHGVGPMRRYCLGALLLALDDPSQVIGHLRVPLIEPDAPLRNGYVPNVVYTCGGLVHHGRLILPYGRNDTTTTIETADLKALLSLLKEER